MKAFFNFLWAMVILAFLVFVILGLFNIPDFMVYPNGY